MSNPRRVPVEQHRNNNHNHHNNTTIILGAGIIGLSTAFYLSQPPPSSPTPHTIHLLDPSPALFASCSGLAGGLVADAPWFAPALAALGKLSFAEHALVAGRYGGREGWGYAASAGVGYVMGRGEGEGGVGERGWSRVEGVVGVGVGVGGGEGEDEDGGKGVPGWLRRREGDEVEVLGEEGTLAQVDPLRLCQFLLKKCLERGVQLHHPARASSILRDAAGAASGVRILNTLTNTESELPCSRILIAAGAWSPSVLHTLFPQGKLKLPITSLAGHSLLVRSPRWSQEHENGDCHAIFTTDEEGGFSPEIFSRLGAEIYVAGLNSSTIPLPELATASKVDAKSAARLKKTTARLLGDEARPEELQVLREGLCFRPVTRRGLPILAQVPLQKLGEVEGEGEALDIFLAAGHGPWGISNSLGTGKVMAELMLGKPTSADIRGLGL